MLSGKWSRSSQRLQGTFGLDQQGLRPWRRAAIHLGLLVAGLFARNLDIVRGDILVNVTAIEPERVGLGGHWVAAPWPQNDLRIRHLITANIDHEAEVDRPH